MTEFNFDKDVSTAHFEAAGWNIDSYNHSNPFNCHLIYVRDYRTGHVQVLSMSMDDFDSLKPKMSASELSGFVGELMLRTYKKTITQKELSIVLSTVGGYIKDTLTYKQWAAGKRYGERFHGFINIYGHIKGQATVRPFIIKDEDTVLSVDMVMESCDHIMLMDKKNHPEWFRR